LRSSALAEQSRRPDQLFQAAPFSPHPPVLSTLGGMRTVRPP